MKQDEKTMALVPVDISQIEVEVPELKKFGYKIDTCSFDPVIDSSDITPDFWVKLCHIIKANYSRYDGFVVLHGTDTMSYTASALSFMLEDLSKPVVLTGSQLPVGMLRTDGKENIISSIEIAAARDADGHPMVPPALQRQPHHQVQCREFQGFPFCKLSGPGGRRYPYKVQPPSGPLSSGLEQTS